MANYKTLNISDGTSSLEVFINQKLKISLIIHDSDSSVYDCDYSKCVVLDKEDTLALIKELQKLIKEF